MQKSKQVSFMSFESYNILSRTFDIPIFIDVFIIPPSNKCTIFLTIEEPLTPCQKEYQDRFRNPVGDVPLCMPDGSYSKLQCYLSTCFCVDVNGNQIRGTSVNSFRDGPPNCDDDDPGMFPIIYLLLMP